MDTSKLEVSNSAEPYRVSNFTSFKRNLLDPALHINVTLAYLICILIIGLRSSSLSFIITFAGIFLAIDYHIESYRSFRAVRNAVELLHKDYKLRRVFLGTRLGYTESRYSRPTWDRASLSRSTSCSASDAEIEGTVDETTRKDTFNWINRIIAFFWPYLSHLIHFELNEFFRNEIESGLLSRSDKGMKLLFYAIVRQLNTNVLVIERCQLGDRPPFIREISVKEGTAAEITTKPSKKKETKVTSVKSIGTVGSKDAISMDGSEISTTNKDKTLVYNINLKYSGDMNISVIYRYLCCCVSRIGLKDVFLHFNMRFIWGPIKKEIPFIDQLSFTLLELPEFGYKGIALVELAELQIVRGVINRLITENLLYPRMLTISLRQLTETLMKGPKEEKRDNGQVGSKRDVSFMTKMTANLLLLGCVCSNALMRSCQKTRSVKDTSRDSKDSATSDNN